MEALGALEEVPASDGPGSPETAEASVPFPAIAEELAAAEPCGSSLGVDAAVAVITQQGGVVTTKCKTILTDKGCEARSRNAFRTTDQACPIQRAGVQTVDGCELDLQSNKAHTEQNTGKGMAL